MKTLLLGSLSLGPKRSELRSFFEPFEKIRRPNVMTRCSIGKFHRRPSVGSFARKEQSILSRVANRDEFRFRPSSRRLEATLVSLFAVIIVFRLGAPLGAAEATGTSMSGIEFLMEQEGISAAATNPLDAAIKELAESSQASQRVHSAELLGQLGDRRATKPLMAALRDSDSGVQRAAALALGELRDGTAVEPLINVTRTNSDPSVRGAAAFALGLTKERRAVEPLIATLKDSNASVRISAAIALGRLGDPRAVEPLLALPHDEAHQQCLPIAVALGQIKSQRAIKPLLDQLNDANADVCQNTAIALVLIGDKNAVEPLIRALQSRQAIIRRSAAYALGLLSDRRATVPLVGRLQDTDPGVRLNAAEGLGRLKDRRALEPLRRVAQSDKDPSVQEAARTAVEKLLLPEKPAGEENR